MPYPKELERMPKKELLKLRTKYKKAKHKAHCKQEFFGMLICENYIKDIDKILKERNRRDVYEPMF